MLERWPYNHNLGVVRAQVQDIESMLHHGIRACSLLCSLEVGVECSPQDHLGLTQRDEFTQEFLTRREGRDGEFCRTSDIQNLRQDIAQLQMLCYEHLHSIFKYDSRFIHKNKESSKPYGSGLSQRYDD